MCWTVNSQRGSMVPTSPTMTSGQRAFEDGCDRLPRDPAMLDQEHQVIVAHHGPRHGDAGPCRVDPGGAVTDIA